MSKKPKAIRFFGLILRESSAMAYAFEQTDSDVEIIKSAPFSYTKNFEKVLDDTDTIMYEFETALKFHFHKIIFILPFSGLKGEGEEVVQPYRSAISEIVHNLELEAMGYIEIIDVLKEDLLQHESTVYIEVGKLKTHIVFLRNGEQWNQQSVNTNPANIVSHLTEYITQGTNIYVYQIHEGVNMNPLIAAMSEYIVHLCTADEISVSLQHLLKRQLLVAIETTRMEESASVASSQDMEEVTEHVSSAPDGEGGSSIVIDTQDITIQESAPPVVTAPSTPTPLPPAPDTIAGFKIFGNRPRTVDDGYVHGPPHTRKTMTEHVSSAVYPDQAITPHTEPPSAQLQEPSSSLESDMVTPVEDSASTESPKKKGISVVKSLGMSLGIIFTITLAGIIVFELYLHKVTLKVTVPTETYALKQALTAIPVSKVIEEREVLVSVDTTGEKEVGERAKGTVMVASFDDKEASFSAGTQLLLNTSVYRLDADVVLPPATIDTSTGTKQASKKVVAASATFIGPEGNVEKGKQFVVEDYPSSLFYAISDSKFAGGTQQTVSVVAPQDIQKLKTLVTEKAKQASESARAGTSGDVVTLDDISSVDIEGLTYSAETGEIASAVRAEGSVKAILYTVQKAKLLEVIQKSLDTDKGKNYRFLNGEVSYTFNDIELSSDEQTCDMNFQTTLDVFKALDVPTIKNAIRMKLDTQATTILTKEYHVTGVRFVYNPDLPLFRSFVPYRKENIEIEIDPAESNE